MNISVTGVIYDNWIVFFTVNNPQVSFNVTACINEGCISKEYFFKCFYPLNISVDVNTIYAEVETLMPITVTMNGGVLQMNELSGLWIENRLNDMILEKTGVIRWLPPQKYSGQSRYINVHAGYSLNPLADCNK